MTLNIEININVLLLSFTYAFLNIKKCLSYTFYKFLSTLDGVLLSHSTAAMLLFLAAQKWSQSEFLLFQRFLQNTTLPPGTGGPSRQGNLAGYSGRGSLICFNIDWFDLLAPQSTQESSLAPQFKSIKSSLLNIFGPTLTAIYECWKNW